MVIPPQRMFQFHACRSWKAGKVHDVMVEWFTLCSSDACSSSRVSRSLIRADRPPCWSTCQSNEHTHTLSLQLLSLTDVTLELGSQVPPAHQRLPSTTQSEEVASNLLNLIKALSPIQRHRWCTSMFEVSRDLLADF